MTASSAWRICRACLWTIFLFPFFFATSRSAFANGSDLPPQIVLQGFVELENGRAHLLLRVPLSLLDNFALPKRGPGYLDLSNIDPKLKQAATAFGRQIELSADGAALPSVLREWRLSFLSDRSFASDATARSHFQEAPLPVETNLFWNQGFFDVHFEYALPLARPRLQIRVKLGAELGPRIKLQLEYLRAGQDKRSYDISGDSGWLPLDPGWADAAWLFAKTGFFGTFAVDRFVFLLCLAAPFLRFRGVLALVAALAALQALTLTAVAQGALADVEAGWLPVLSDTVLAAAVISLAIANLARPTLRRRGFLTALVGALGGFGLSRLLNIAAPFAGAHTAVAFASFNVGAASGQVVASALAFYALRLLFARVLGPLLGVVILSAWAAHAGWHGMVDGGRELGLQFSRVQAAGLWPVVVTVALWLLPALLAGLLAWLLPRRYDGAVVPTLSNALRPHRS